MLAWLSILAYRSSGGAKRENLGDKIAKFAPGRLLMFIASCSMMWRLPT